MSKAYEAAKRDLDDVTTLLQFNEHFWQNISLRRASQTESIQHRSHVASTKSIPQPSIDSYPQIIYVVQLALWRQRDVQRSQQVLDLKMKQAMKTGEKDPVDTVGSKVIFPLGVQKVALKYTIFEVTRIEQGVFEVEDVFFFFHC